MRCWRARAAAAPPSAAMSAPCSRPAPSAKDTLSARCPAGKRKELRRQRRRLEDIAPVTFATTSGAAGIEAALKDFLVLEASGWKGLAGTAIVNDPAIKNFVQSAVMGARRRRAGADRPAVPQRHRHRRHHDAASGDTAWCWKIAYNEGLARSSPGVQLICDLTESLLAATAPRASIPAPPPAIR